MELSDAREEQRRTQRDEADPQWLERSPSWSQPEKWQRERNQTGERDERNDGAGKEEALQHQRLARERRLDGKVVELRRDGSRRKPWRAVQPPARVDKVSPLMFNMSTLTFRCVHRAPTSRCA